MNIQTKIERTWGFCIKEFGLHRLIALTHHGSYNYNLALPDSDADAKLFIVPTWYEILHCEKPTSKTIDGPYGDINVCDIRLFISNNLPKQNFNFLECLFSPYYCVNPDYFDIWEDLRSYREAIAHYAPVEAVRTMMGQVENQYKRWDKFDNNKTLYHMLRIEYAIHQYVEGEPFVMTLAPQGEDHDFIMLVREGSFDKRTMEKIFNDSYNRAHKYAERASSVKNQEFVAETVMERTLDRFIHRAFENRFKN